jgi:hypothetical protein
MSVKAMTRTGVLLAATQMVMAISITGETIREAWEWRSLVVPPAYSLSADQQMGGPLLIEP